MKKIIIILLPLCLFLCMSCHDTGPDPIDEPVDPMDTLNMDSLKVDSIVEFIKAKLGGRVFSGNVFLEDYYYNSAEMAMVSVLDTFFNEEIVLDSIYLWNNPNYSNNYIFEFSSDWLLYEKWLTTDSTILSEGVVRFYTYFGSHSFEYKCNLKEKTITTDDYLLYSPNPGYRRSKGFFKL